MEEKKNVKKVVVYTERQRGLKSRLTNVGTIISLASIVIVLLMQLGVIDQTMGENVKTIVYLLCSVGVVLGVLNNPVGDGIYLPGVDYPIFGSQPTKVDIENVVGNKVIDTIEEVKNIDVAKDSEDIKNKLENK